MTWLLAVAVPAVVIGSGGTMLALGDKLPLPRRAREWLALPGRLVMPHHGHHRGPCGGPAAWLCHPLASLEYGWRWGHEQIIRRRIRRRLTAALNARMAMMTPAPHAAAGQAQTAAPVASPAGAATIPALGRAPEADATTRDPSGGAAALPLPPGGPVPAGQGQRPQGQPVVWHRPDGTRIVIGWGPKAEIPRPSVNLRVTGAHVVVPDTMPLVSRRYGAFEARRDRAVNTP